LILLNLAFIGGKGWSSNDVNVYKRYAQHGKLFKDSRCRNSSEGETVAHIHGGPPLQEPAETKRRYKEPGSDRVVNVYSDPDKAAVQQYQIEHNVTDA
jgi:hypothetical protein